jgi:hypothetical protein
MKRRLTSLGFAVLSLAAATGLAAPANARELTLTTTLARNFFGGAYMVVYLVDAEGRYKTTLWVSGTTSRYYNQFRHWYRATDVARIAREPEYDGKTGASVRRGEVVTITVDLADEFFDAGYVLRIDSSVYEARDVPSDVTIPLSTEAAGVAAAGRGYVESLKFEL